MFNPPKLPKAEKCKMKIKRNEGSESIEFSQNCTPEQIKLIRDMRRENTEKLDMN